jgi:hypothetical protein
MRMRFRRIGERRDQTDQRQKAGVTGQPSDGADPVTTDSPVWLPVPPAN